MPEEGVDTRLLKASTQSTRYWDLFKKGAN